MSDQAIDRAQDDDFDPAFRALIEQSKEDARQREDIRRALIEVDNAASPRIKTKRTGHRMAMTDTQKIARRARLSAKREERKNRCPKKQSKVTFFGHARTPGPKPVRLVPAERQEAA